MPVHGLVYLNEVAVVVKTIERYFSDRYKGFAHSILLSKFLVASMNAMAVSFFFFQEVHEILNQVNRSLLLVK